jgi:hypothetical protein
LFYDPPGLSMRLADDLLDLLQMLPAMLSAKHVERTARSLVSHKEVVRQRRHFPIGRLGDPDGKLGGPARSQGEQKRLHRVVDPVAVRLVQGAR